MTIIETLPSGSYRENGKKNEKNRRKIGKSQQKKEFFPILGVYI
jgi:hypothetical protein